jgi:hypothetical protein
MSDLSSLPSYELKRFARWVAKATEKYFEDPEVKIRFEKWQSEKMQK